MNQEDVHARNYDIRKVRTPIEYLAIVVMGDVTTQ
jgi:hypothetical protein